VRSLKLGIFTNYDGDKIEAYEIVGTSSRQIIRGEMFIWKIGWEPLREGVTSETYLKIIAKHPFG